MEQARKSSARTSASRGLPTSVRSPQRTSTSALVEISANSSRNNDVRSSLMCRSPMAANVNMSDFAGMSSLTLLTYVGEAPFFDGRLVIDLRQHLTTAYLHTWGRQVELSLEPTEQLVHEPARYVFALARISPAEVEKMDQEHFPVQVHVAEKTPPIDPIMLFEYEVHDVRAIVAMSQLDEGLGPNQLGRCDDTHRYAEHLDTRCVLEPLIAHGHNAVPGGEDHVEEMLTAEDFGDPTLVLDLDGITQAFEAIEDARVIARFTKDVEVLGCARDAGIGAERVSAGQQKRKTELRQLAQGLCVKGLGQRRRCGRLGCGINRVNSLGDCSGLACHETVGQRGWESAAAASPAPIRQSNSAYKVPSPKAFVSHDAARARDAAWEGASLADILDRQFAGFSKRVDVSGCDISSLAHRQLNNLP